MPFRIAIGECKCKEPYRDRIEEIACGLVSHLLRDWRARLPEDLAALPKEAYDDVVVEGRLVTVGTHRMQRDEGGTLVVFQALVHTWRWATYISLGAVGRMYAEGLLVSESGEVSPASDEDLWGFR